MRAIRTVAVGLVFAGVLTWQLLPVFVRIVVRAPEYALGTASHPMGVSPILDGVWICLPTAFVLLCVGVGLMLSSILWRPIEDVLFGRHRIAMAVAGAVAPARFESGTP